MAAGRKAYAGALHVHTSQNGGASFDEILEAARAASLDFVVLTDHGVTLSEEKKQEGYYDGIYVLTGEEVCAPDGHFLAFDTHVETGEVDSYKEGFQRVHSQSGLTVGTHYHLSELGTPQAIPDPIPVSEVDLVELWSFQDEFLVNARGQLPLQYHHRPEELIKGPPRRTVREWDRECIKRPVPAIGSVNAIGRKEPLLDWKEFFTCTSSFNTIRTVVYCQELPERDTATKLIWRALREGRSYIVNHGLAPADGFLFQYVGPQGETHDIGETVGYEHGGHIKVLLSQEAEVVLRLNGHPLFWGSGKDVLFPAPVPGIYRAEARIGQRCWIFTNPIRVVEKPGAPGGRTTVVDFT